MFSTLIDKIVEILEANTLIAEVFNHEAEQLTGDPSVIVSPSGNESDYSTTSENVRVYAFSVKVFVKRKIEGTDRNPSDADRVLRTLIDSILDDFDKNYTFTGISTPTGYTMINVFALPSSWGYAGEIDEYRVSEIIIKCRINVDVTQIS